MEDKKNADAEPAEESLEQAATIVDAPETDKKDGDPDVIAADENVKRTVGAPLKPSVAKQTQSWLLSLNIWLLLFVFVLVVAGVIAFFSYSYSKKKSGSGGTINTTTLTPEVLSQLTKNDATVGSSGQVLYVQSSAVFTGKILARSDLEVAGNLVLGGLLNVPSINVAGNAGVGQLNVSRNMAVTGDTAIQGQVTISKTLQVGGSGTFTGPLSAPQITVGSLQLGGDLVISHHITAGGGTPGRSVGTALGSGGTASVSGTDTAGSVSINTGGGPPAGCFITVNFVTKFNSTPYVQVTPVGSSAGGIAYYVTKTTAGFSICTATAPPANANFGFDYFVIN